MRTGHDPRPSSLGALQERLGYRFRAPELLERALVHRSAAHERGATQTNEPLEFLGDAVLGFVVAERIYRRRPDLDEGAMTRLRSSIVNARSLAREAIALGIDRAIELGRGEALSGGRTKPSLLADALEAVLGAVLLDGGVRQARAVIHRLFGKRIDEAPGADARAHRDPKTRLQEYAQARGWTLPVYDVVATDGPDHARRFTVEVVVDDRVRGRGAGRSKKTAEQEAATEALRSLGARWPT